MIVRQYAPCNLGRNTICLGKQGEINALRVEFDVSAWMAMYPDATVKLMHFAPDRPQDNPVIPTLGVEGTTCVWIVGEDDTASAGNGVIELLLIDERTGSTIKSATGYTTVLHSPSAGIEAQEAEAGYVRYDIDQSALLTDEQKAVARKNIGAGTGDGTGGGTGGITVEKDPTVPEWAKQPSKPTYTASEVGARPDTWMPSASDVGADAAGTAAAQVGAHNVSGEAHADLRALIEGLTSRLNALADSDDTTLDQLSEIVAYIKSNKALIDAVTTGKVSTSDIVDNLTTNASGKVLSAAQGVRLKALIDAIVIPDKLPNPQPLTINGQSYDGSAKVEVTVTGEGAGVEVDNTLTQSGKAADAKVVGDKLSELNQANAQQDERLNALEQAGGVEGVIARNTEANNLIRSAKKMYNDSEGGGTYGSYSKNDLFAVAHISDLHTDPIRYENFLKFVAGNPYINAAVITGDMVDAPLPAQFADMLAVETHGVKPLKVVGNHERYFSGTSMSNEDIYANWGLTTGTGLTYYCVDYASSGIRIIVLNAYDTTASDSKAGAIEHFSQDQIDWFVATLQDSATKGYAVMVCRHSMEYGMPTTNDKAFFQRWNQWESMFSNVCSGTPIEDIVNAYRNGASLSQTYTFSDTGESITVDASFGTAGSFVAYMNGHHHVDNIGYSKKYPNQLYLSIACGVCVSNYRDGNWDTVSDLIRLAGTKTEDLFNVYVIDTTHKKVKVIRVGSDVNDLLEERKCEVYDYTSVDVDFEQIPATSISLSASELTFESSDPQTLTATVEPSNTTDTVIWTTSASSVARVSGGVVTPTGNGTATITATAGSVSASCNVTVAGMEDEGLIPSGYTQVDYLSSAQSDSPTASDLTTTPYIKTEFPDADIDVLGYTITCVYQAIFTGVEGIVFGGRNGMSSSLTTAGICFYVSDGANVRTQYGYNSSGKLIVLEGLAHDSTKKSELVLHDGLVTIDGVQIADTGAVHCNCKSSYPIALFGRNNAGKYDATSYGGNLSPFIGKIYSFSIKDENGNLVLNYIPCMRNSDSVYGMYDTVKGVFHTSAISTGFSGGND